MLQETKNIQIGELIVDLSKRSVITGNTEVTLTNREFEILYLLASSQGRVFSKEQIYDLVWEEPYSGDYNIVMSHIRNIREKIEQPIYIQTVWGVGYRFNKNLSSGL
ncbi:winged helix-turn-helix domain-containing protein [Roseburia sp. AM59-24XD]|jgi:DNA-binding response OmpR family regulator|uniref:winged helix-turn-helix domain-containing protein n=1 Tax=Roseburia sp. AM59-24XD TaxID=2293138 RepID=UPI001FAB1E25|nr:winged helix-turn-helix domain-containing protein [Roseburia sp. AM59-24XD]